MAMHLGAGRRDIESVDLEPKARLGPDGVTELREPDTFDR